MRLVWLSVAGDSSARRARRFLLGIYNHIDRFNSWQGRGGEGSKAVGRAACLCAAETGQMHYCTLSKRKCHRHATMHTCSFFSLSARDLRTCSSNQRLACSSSASSGRNRNATKPGASPPRLPPTEQTRKDPAHARGKHSLTRGPAAGKLLDPSLPGRHVPTSAAWAGPDTRVGWDMGLVESVACVRSL